MCWYRNLINQLWIEVWPLIFVRLREAHAGTVWVRKTEGSLSSYRDSTPSFNSSKYLPVITSRMKQHSHAYQGEQIGESKSSFWTKTIAHPFVIWNWYLAHQWNCRTLGTYCILPRWTHPDPVVGGLSLPIYPGASASSTVLTPAGSRPLPPHRLRSMEHCKMQDLYWAIHNGRITGRIGIGLRDQLLHHWVLILSEYESQIEKMGYYIEQLEDSRVPNELSISRTPDRYRLMSALLEAAVYIRPFPCKAEIHLRGPLSHMYEDKGHRIENHMTCAVLLCSVDEGTLPKAQSMKWVVEGILNKDQRQSGRNMGTFNQVEIINIMVYTHRRSGYYTVGIMTTLLLLTINRMLKATVRGQGLPKTKRKATTKERNHGEPVTRNRRNLDHWHWLKFWETHDSCKKNKTQKKSFGIGGYSVYGIIDDKPVHWHSHSIISQVSIPLKSTTLLSSGLVTSTPVTTAMCWRINDG